jgi:hypothetical protein
MQYKSKSEALHPWRIEQEKTTGFMFTGDKTNFSQREGAPKEIMRHMHLPTYQAKC